MLKLRELIRTESNAKQRDRFRSVLLGIEGESGVELEGDQIALRLGRSPQFVDQWLARYRQGGLEALYPKKAKGRPKKLPAEAEPSAAPPGYSGARHSITHASSSRGSFPFMSGGGEIGQKTVGSGCASDSQLSTYARSITAFHAPGWSRSIANFTYHIPSSVRPVPKRGRIAGIRRR